MTQPAKDLTEALAALTEQANQAKREAMKPRGAAPAATSAATLPGSASGAGGVSNMTETAYADRTWHDAVILPSTDGILFARLVPVKTIKFNDASGTPYTFEFKAPT